MVMVFIIPIPAFTTPFTLLCSSCTMIKNSFLPAIAAMLILSCCSSCSPDKDGYEMTESGLRYRFIEEKNGPKPALGDLMLMHISYRAEPDTILFDSRNQRDSFTVVLVEPTFMGGVEEGFAMMGSGDSAMFKASADSLFAKTFNMPLPSYINKGSLITFQVRLNSIIPKAVYDSLQSVRDRMLRQEEFSRIDSFLLANHMDVTPTENGAFMLTTDPGTGDLPKAGDTIVVHYTGRLLDGTEFDGSRNQGKPFRFVLGAREVIPGWEECFPFLNKGSRAKLVIPSDLAYGGKTYGVLPAYSTLSFDVEIVDIIPGQRNELVHE